MILTAHQPAYLPWLGYFDKLIRSDIFIFLDTVQYEKNSFINRNRIKTPQGAIWLTVPIKTKGHTHSTVLETQIRNSENWRKKHLKSIFLNYKKAPRSEECYPKLEILYQQEHELLADLCFEHLRFWLKEMKIEKNIVRSSRLPISSKKSDLILDLCKYFSANHYISGPLGKNYIKEEDFLQAGISIEYQNYQHPKYPQLWGSFLTGMSIVDYWLNTNQYWLITRGERNQIF